MTSDARKFSGIITPKLVMELTLNIATEIETENNHRKSIGTSLSNKNCMTSQRTSTSGIYFNVNQILTDKGAVNSRTNAESSVEDDRCPVRDAYNNHNRYRYCLVYQFVPFQHYCFHVPCGYSYKRKNVKT